MKKRLIFSLVAMSLIPILASCNSGKGGNTSNINSITNNTSTNS
jgi:protein involved in sex pheromone biosynthesis